MSTWDFAKRAHSRWKSDNGRCEHPIANAERAKAINTACRGSGDSAFVAQSLPQGVAAVGSGGARLCSGGSLGLGAVLRLCAWRPRLRPQMMDRTVLTSIRKSPLTMPTAVLFESTLLPMVGNVSANEACKSGSSTEICRCKTSIASASWSPQGRAELTSGPRP